jgi:hypothetical protein
MATVGRSNKANKSQDPVLVYLKEKRARGVAQVLERLPSKV